MCIRDSLTPAKREAVAAEMADVFIYLLQLSTALDVDLLQAAQLKIDLNEQRYPCLLYTSDAADERSSVDLGGRRIIKNKTKKKKKAQRTQRRDNSDRAKQHCGTVLDVGKTHEYNTDSQS